MNRLVSALQRENKTYYEIPNNWDIDLAPYIEHDLSTCKSKISQCINSNAPIAFIDACSIIKLATIINNDPLIKDICDKYEAIIISGEVVKELSFETKVNGVVKNPSDWVPNQVAVVRYFSKYKKILYIQETDLCEHLLTHIGDHNILEKRTLNFMIQIANSKNYVNKITILTKEEESFESDFIHISNMEPEYTKRVIQYLKGKKKCGDSLAELLILIIINMFIVEDMTKFYFISDDRRADIIYKKVIVFQNTLKNKKAITEIKFMGRVELIYFVKSCVINNTISSDSEIIEYCKIYLGDNGTYKTSVSGGMYPDPEIVSLTSHQLLSYMRSPHYNFHSTSNRNISVHEE